MPEVKSSGKEMAPLHGRVCFAFGGIDKSTLNVKDSIAAFYPEQQRRDSKLASRANYIHRFPLNLKH